MKKILFQILFALSLIVQTATGQIRFAWITDTHIGSPNAEIDLIKVIEDINKRNISFTIVTGDLTEKGLNSELILTKKILSNLKKPYFVIPGNHDTKWSESGCTKFNELFGDDRFIFFLNDYCFIGINSGIPLRGGGGHISIEDLEWLRNKLKKLSSHTKIIFAVHHQLDAEVDNSIEVIELFNKFKNAFVIVGHGHINRSYDFDGVKGAMGRSSLSKNKTPGYNIVELKNDSIYIQTIDFNENKLWYQNNLLIKKSFTDDKSLKPNILQSKELRQIFDCKSTIVKSGLLDKGSLFIGDLSGNIYSIRLNGKLNWKQFFPTSFFSKPVVYRDQIIFCGTDGNIYFLKKSNGLLQKKISIGSTIIASPILEKNLLIVFSNDGSVNYINLQNFKITRKKIGEKNFETIPSSHQDKIIIGNWDNYLYAVSKNPDDTISIFWKWTENKNFYYSPAACSPVIDKQNRVFISTPDKFISAIDFNTGKTVFRSNNFNSWEAIGIDQQKQILFIKGLVDTVYALSLNGLPNLKWKSSLGYGLDTNPINISVIKDKVLIPAKNGNLYILDRDTGKLLKSFFLGNSRLNEILSINKSQILISNMDGKIYLINLN
jgi:outer membrane protein assembly factor BamB